MAEKNYLDKTGLALVWEKIKNIAAGKVDKETGKGLSSNDYTSDQKTKLANIATGAQVNVLEGIQKNGTNVTITNKIANITVPTKTSDITNDSGFITSSDIPEGAAASSTTPKMNGTAAVGTELAFARGDHVHPTDTSRASATDVINLTGRVDDLEEAGAFVPPEEDPEKTYYPITISSINAATSPQNGTTRVQAGTNQVITITPFDPQLTLALDNGVDITSQLVSSVPQNTYTITTKVTGASYGFNLNSSTGYYVSTNNGVSKSASVARLNMNFESDCLVTITYINYAEEDYDYGMFGKLDTQVATDGLTAGSGGSSPSDSTSNYQLAKCSNSSGTQTITYTVPAGEHFIDIKYGKDDASDSGNDSLQWKVTSVQATSAGGDYTYTLTNIQQKHSLVFIFGNVSYYFINSSSTGDCKLFPDGQMVKLQGDSYSLTIVPTNINATVSILDNNINTTSALEYEQGQDKYGNTVVNYKYKLTNITATHNLVISCSGGSAKIYFKNNNSWVYAVRVYIKVNGSWVEQSNLENVFDSRINYIKGN